MRDKTAAKVHRGIFMPISDENREAEQHGAYRDRRDSFGQPAWVEAKTLAEAAEDLFDLYVPDANSVWAHSAGPQPLQLTLAQAGSVLASHTHDKVCITAAGVSP
jgi:hypothetical protein